MSLLFKSNPEKKEKLAHVIAGFIILVDAYEKYDLQESSYIYFLNAGLVFMGVAVFHHRLAHRFHYIDGIFFVIEAIVYCIIAAGYFHHGKKALPWCYVLIAAGYCFVAIVKARKGKVKYSNRQNKPIT